MQTATSPRLGRISLTGADDNVSLEALAQLSARYPFVEWALLYVPHNEGAPRNPSRAWRLAFFKAQLPGYSAVHLCGRQAFEEVLAGTLPTEILLADRLQLNINARKQDFTDAQVLEVFRQALDLGPDIILQYHKGTAAVIRAFLLEVPKSARHRVHILMDESKGTGKVLGTASPPEGFEDMYCGFAGGLAPDNMDWALALMEQGGRAYWADMESGIRTENEFDVDKARRVLEAGARVRETVPVAPAEQAPDEPPRTFGCHHVAESCRLCEGLVESWKAERHAQAGG